MVQRNVSEFSAHLGPNFNKSFSTLLNTLHASLAHVMNQFYCILTYSIPKIPLDKSFSGLTQCFWDLSLFWTKIRQVFLHTFKQSSCISSTCNQSSSLYCNQVFLHTPNNIYCNQVFLHTSKHFSCISSTCNQSHLLYSNKIGRASCRERV